MFDRRIDKSSNVLKFDAISLYITCIGLNDFVNLFVTGLFIVFMYVLLLCIFMIVYMCLYTVGLIVLPGTLNYLLFDSVSEV